MQGQTTERDTQDDFRKNTAVIQFPVSRSGRADKGTPPQKRPEKNSEKSSHRKRGWLWMHVEGAIQSK